MHSTRGHQMQSQHSEVFYYVIAAYAAAFIAVLALPSTSYRKTAVATTPIVQVATGTDALDNGHQQTSLLDKHPNSAL